MSDLVLAPDSGTPARAEKSFAVVLTWPDIKNAEYEVVQRVVAAGQRIGARVAVVDNDGYVLWSTAVTRVGARLTEAECQFAISLHFESPRLFDVFSYAALWNPPEFYSVFGYQRSVEQLATHNDVLSCRSELADAHAANVFAGFGRELSRPLPEMFHSLPGPFLEPNITEDSRLFYVGINWERISGEKGRHHDLLMRLNDEDLIAIYGPEEFQGVQPWRGFTNYRGSIPFDGRSILGAINSAGICLAFSSAAHQRSGIMSNRLFEGLAAGAVVIANPHSFIDRHFADCVYVIDDQAEPAEVSNRVRDIVLEVRRDPDIALERARRGQARLKEVFALELSLESLFANHSSRVGTFTEKALGASPHRVHVMLAYIGQDVGILEEMIANAGRQRHVEIELSLVCDCELHDAFRERIDRLCSDAARSVNVVTGSFQKTASRLGGTPERLEALGPAVARALASVKADLFCIMQPGEHWFSEHLASLAQTLARAPESQFACSGRIDETPAAGTERRRLQSLGFTGYRSLIDGAYPGDAGRFLYRADLIRSIPTDLLRCLDGLENRAFSVWALMVGPLALSNFATFVRQIGHSFERDQTFLISSQQQVEAIRDSVRTRPEWLRLRPEIWLQDDASLAPPNPAVASMKEPFRIERNRMYEVRKGAEAIDALREGFSHPEASFVWLNGRVGKLEVELAEDIDDEQDLVLLVSGRRNALTNEDQTCTVLVNGDVVLEDAAVPEAPTELRATLSKLHLQRGNLLITLRIKHADPVADSSGRIVDQRHLGMTLAGFGVFSRTKQEVEQVAAPSMRPTSTLARATLLIYRQLRRMKASLLSAR